MIADLSSLPLLPLISCPTLAGVIPKEFRKLLNEKQEDLANILGVTRQTIISIEKGKYNPSILLAFKMANHFGKSIEEIFIYEEEE